MTHHQRNPELRCTLIFVIDTIDGITFSTILETSEVTTLEDLDNEALLLTALVAVVLVFVTPVNPSTLLPTTLDARNVPLETTPNNSANPVTATALGIFFLWFSYHAALDVF